MERRPFGWTEAPVPIIGQGTWNLEQDARDDAVAALRRGLDAGLTHIDTAELYGNGKVEALVGEAIAGRRAEVFLVSKVHPSNASFEGTIRACERSLAALKTDHLDLYLLHWPSSHPLVDTIAAFEQLVRDGKIRWYGVSNFDADELEHAVAIAGERRIACNQVLYHLLERYVEARVIPACERHHVAVVAYSPFGSGRFPAPGSSGGALLRSIAETHGATPRQVALRFLVRRHSVFAIPKAASPAHAVENGGAGDLDLSLEEYHRLERAFPVRPRRELPVL